jgi:hypothetical protein
VTSQLSIALMLCLFGIATGASISADDGVGAFRRSIEDYLALRQRLEPTLPPLAMSSNPQQIHAAVDARATAIREARAHQAAGAIFNSTVSALFRRRIQDGVSNSGDAIAGVLQQIREESTTRTRPVVNGRFSWATAVATPASILSLLPALPDELQYRFVGRDLVLVDIDANLVIDVLPDALVASGRPGRE